MRNPKHRVSLTKFCLSDHKLHIEMGRHQKFKLPLEDRICPLCKDEIHFLLNCEKLFADRLCLKTKTYCDNYCLFSSKQKFRFFMTVEKPEIVRFLAKLGRKAKIKRCGYSADTIQLSNIF